MDCDHTRSLLHIFLMQEKDGIRTQSICREDGRNACRQAKQFGCVHVGGEGDSQIGVSSFRFQLMVEYNPIMGCTCMHLGRLYCRLYDLSF